MMKVFSGKKKEESRDWMEQVICATLYFLIKSKPLDHF